MVTVETKPLRIVTEGEAMLDWVFDKVPVSLRDTLAAEGITDKRAVIVRAVELQAERVRALRLAESEKTKS